MDNKTTGPGFRAENRPVRRTRRGSPDRCANNAAAAPPSPPPQPPPPRFPRATGTAGWPGRASALKSRAGKTQAWGRRRQPALARTISESPGGAEDPGRTAPASAVKPLGPRCPCQWLHGSAMRSALHPRRRRKRGGSPRRRARRSPL